MDNKDEKDDKTELGGTTEDDEKKLQEEKEQASNLLKETNERNAAKSKFRTQNQNAADHRPDEDYFHKLDSSLKKNTAFVKKLGKLTEQQRSSLEKEFNSLNLTRYIQEVVSTIVDAKLKMSDVPCAVYICSLMHRRYSDFTTLLFQTLRRTFQQRNEDKANLCNIMSKLRTELRFVSELTVAGILTDKGGLTLVYNQLSMMINVDKDKHDLLSVVISLCKHCGEDLAGLISRKNRTLASKFDIELPRSNVFAAEKQKIFYNALTEYWQSVRDHLLKIHKELKKMDKSNKQILQTKGELHEERSKAFQEKQSSYLKLSMNCNTLADLLDVDVPDLPEDELTSQDPDSSINIYDPAVKGAELLGEQSPWEDEDQMSFYTNLLDLKAIIPAILFKDNAANKSGKKSPSKRTRMKSGSQEKPIGPKISGKGEESIDRIAEDMSEIDIGQIDDAAKDAVQKATEAATAVVSGNAEENNDDVDEDDDDIAENEEDIEKQVLGQDDETEEEDVNLGTTMKLMMENFITSLQNCINRDLIDRAAQDFCMNLNTRVNRRKLVRALFNVHRSRLDLLSFYGRLVATLHPCMPDVAENLTTMLLKDYRFHMRKKDQIHIESKVKTVRFIGEVTKFGMISHSDTLNCLKQLIHDFSPHAIEMACGLLEVCGCFLFRTPETHLLTRVLLEQLMRKRTAKPLDTRYSTMIDNAYYYCNPPEVEKVVQKPRPPLHQYIRKLIYKDLSKSTVEKVLRQMRKLQWTEEPVKNYAIRVLTQVWNVKFNNVHCLASLVAGLISYQDDVGIKIVDDLLEEIRIGMEIIHPRYNQRRISAAKYLGELYNYRMFDSTIIFNTLYSFITFGVSYNHMNPSVLDPPEHLFRIRLVCILLETCGQYFDRGTSKKKLDYFLQYFQRYIWFKKTSSIWSQTTEGSESEDEQQTSKFLKPPFPVEIEYLVQDTIEPLRPKLKLASSIQEANKFVADVEKEIFAKLAEVAPNDNFHSLGNIPSKESQPANVSQQGLQPIPEDSEIRGGQVSSKPVVAPTTATTAPSALDTSSQSGTSDYDSSDEDDDSGKDDDYDEMEVRKTRVGMNDDHTEHTMEDEECIDDEDIIKTDSMQTTPRGSVRHLPSTEDDEFQKALDNIMIESLQARKTTQVQQQDMTVPVSVKKSMLKNDSPGEDNAIKFLLLTKKAGKQTLKPLLIPKTEHLAASLKDRAQAEQKQKQELKKITLSINERQVEEEHQQELFNSTRSPPANLNRERRPKYQPPKGAPNADLIFNTGGSFLNRTMRRRGSFQKRGYVRYST
uniref:regulator of nonsense transcripts 2-like isoform X1 n=1 Tax=Styela clava TaxID=7725 RepID=UPI00193ABC7E|nr:regulator of nonsense transcripts 2-like isoform X1 [Styela clava]